MSNFIYCGKRGGRKAYILGALLGFKFLGWILPLIITLVIFVWLPRFGASHPELKQLVNTGSPGPLIQVSTHYCSVRTPSILDQKLSIFYATDILGIEFFL